VLLPLFSFFGMPADSMICVLSKGDQRSAEGLAPEGFFMKEFFHATFPVTSHCRVSPLKKLTLQEQQ